MGLSRTKTPRKIFLPRRSKRLLMYGNSPDIKYIHKRSKKNLTNITDLPNELLLEIFSNLTPQELFYSVRPVCQHWKHLAMLPTLWTKMEIDNKVPTSILNTWVRAAPLLKQFMVKDRNDLNVLTKEVAKNCKQLETLEVIQCWGSPSNSIIRSKPLCHLVSRCSKLRRISLQNSRFTSCKFFKLLTRGNAKKQMKCCSYVGPMSPKQLHALLHTIRECELEDSAVIGGVTGIYKLQQVVKVLNRFQNEGHVFVDALWNALNSERTNVIDNFNFVEVPELE